MEHGSASLKKEEKGEVGEENERGGCRGEADIFGQAIILLDQPLFSVGCSLAAKNKGCTTASIELCSEACRLSVFPSKRVDVSCRTANAELAWHMNDI